ncbi:helix-turn-helix transcriptional regulator [Nonomuraea fuscirosea]|jgi:transcriptional regulator with XRE-family HTH domain|uniref:helix-turn-helix domain-containing protein n=1 Tax=Nonomuraea fuscirosea TaxID=1291556 RepID=UPI002DD8C8E7|nr:helix-turn-helix transcriptional regulator [Nonomuraea fuscirosea]WSA53828.1 helix-turn-helix transcriptional regulator [Nonomuraea fuscirosea]
MSVNRELADFLRRARSKVDPARAGLPPDDRIRRVPGLRREEVALLAGVSTDYYTRLEQGRRITPSDQVIDAVANALDLDDAGRTYLRELFGATTRPTRRRAPSVQRVRPGLYQLLDSLDGNPALILGRRTDVLAANRLARALFTDFDAMPPRERNYSRWMFLDPATRDLFVDWEEHARNCVESLRLDLGANPDDPLARDLLATLSERSGEFRAWWAEHGVYQRTFGSKTLRHPVVGELTVEFETFTMPGDNDQTMFVYTTEPGTASREALNLLASWTLTRPGTDPAPTTPPPGR